MTLDFYFYVIFIFKIKNMSKNILNEEINRIKNLMSLSYDDNSLNEQRRGGNRGWRLGLKFWPGARGFGSGGFTFGTSKGKRRHVGFQLGKSGSVEVENQGYMGKIKTDPIDEELTGWKELLNNDSIMVKRMSETSKSNWLTLKNDPEHIGYAVYSLEQFNDTFPEYKWKFVFCDTETNIETIIDRQPKPKKGDDGGGDNAVALPIEFPINGPSNNFFEDNKSVVTQEFIDKLNEEIINPLREIAAGMKNDTGQPKFFLQEMEIATSCSRFRNTGEAATMTWMQLSQSRNNAAKEYIITQLTSLGVLIDNDTEITQHIDGDNGDGSSGPNPPSPYVFTKDGKTIITNESDRATYGEPIKVKGGYNDYKYCIAGLTILANKNLNPEPSGDGEGDKDVEYETIKIDVPTKDFEVRFYSEAKYFGFGFRLPKIYVDWQKRYKTRFWQKVKSKFKRKRKFNTLKCMKW